MTRGDLECGNQALFIISITGEKLQHRMFPSGTLLNETSKPVSCFCPVTHSLTHLARQGGHNMWSILVVTVAHSVGSDGNPNSVTHLRRREIRHKDISVGSPFIFIVYELEAKFTLEEILGSPWGHIYKRSFHIHWMDARVCVCWSWFLTSLIWMGLTLWFSLAAAGSGSSSSQLGGVGQDPLPELGDPGADARQVGLCASNAPADDATQEPSAVFTLHHQRSTRVSLQD